MMDATIATPEQVTAAIRNKKMELGPGNHQNKFEQQRNLFIAEGSGTIVSGDAEEIIQQNRIYMFKQGEAVEFRVKEKLVVYYT